MNHSRFLGVGIVSLLAAYERLSREGGAVSVKTDGDGAVVATFIPVEELLIGGLRGLGHDHVVLDDPLNEPQKPQPREFETYNRNQLRPRKRNPTDRDKPWRRWPVRR